MQIVLEQGSINKSMTFNIGLLQLIFHSSVCVHLVIYMYAKVFSIQIYIPIFQRNSVEGLHFSTFHFYYELIIVNYNYLNYHKLLV